MALGFIHPSIEIIRQSISCEASWVVRFSCYLDLNVLDALSYDRYANHNHSLKVMGSFVLPRQEQQEHLHSSNYSVLYHLSAVHLQNPGLCCHLTFCVKYQRSKRRNVCLKVSFSCSFGWFYPLPRLSESVLRYQYWEFRCWEEMQDL